MNVKNNYLKPEPLLKWAGGKRLLFEVIDSVAGKFLDFSSFDNYVELFFGAGGMFFAEMFTHHFPNATISDINSEVIGFYRNVRDFPDQLYERIKELTDSYNRLATIDEKKERYLLSRERYNETILLTENTLEQSSLLYLMNKGGFNGLYRVNQSGIYNVPFGKRATIDPPHYDVFKTTSGYLGNVTILNENYTRFDISPAAQGRTLYYFDPPYRSMTKTASFVQYTKRGFNDDEQIYLSKICQQIVEQGDAFILSNSDPTRNDPPDVFFDNLYKGFIVEHITAPPRSINAKEGNGKRSPEIVVVGQ